MVGRIPAVLEEDYGDGCCTGSLENADDLGDDWSGAVDVAEARKVNAGEGR